MLFWPILASILPAKAGFYQPIRPFDSVTADIMRGRLVAVNLGIAGHLLFGRCQTNWKAPTLLLILWITGHHEGGSLFESLASETALGQGWHRIRLRPESDARFSCRNDTLCGAPSLPPTRRHTMPCMDISS